MLICSHQLLVLDIWFDIILYRNTHANYEQPTFLHSSFMLFCISVVFFLLVFWVWGVWGVCGGVGGGGGYVALRGRGWLKGGKSVQQFSAGLLNFEPFSIAHTPLPPGGPFMSRSTSFFTRSKPLKSRCRIKLNNFGESCGEEYSALTYPSKLTVYDNRPMEFNRLSLFANLLHSRHHGLSFMGRRTHCVSMFGVALNITELSVC